MGNLSFDTIILGGGPAGLSAAIYAARGAVSTAIIDKNMFGGQPSNYLELENYPGFQVIGGYDLMEKFEEHADQFGVKKFPMQEIEKIDLLAKKIYTKEFEFSAKTIIIATGAQPMKLGVNGEKEFIGRGVIIVPVVKEHFKNIKMCKQYNINIFNYLYHILKLNTLGYKWRKNRNEKNKRNTKRNYINIFNSNNNSASNFSRNKYSNTKWR